MTSMLLDSNIIIYAINTSSPKHAQAKQFIRDNRAKLVLAHQNTLESLRILTHTAYPSPLSIADALKAVTSIADALFVVSPTIDTSYITLELIKKYHLSSNRIFDAYIVGTMLSNSIPSIATDNSKDFTPFQEITVVNPFNQ